MANNKVQLADGTVLMDVTGVTVTPAALRRGVTAMAASGEIITGTMEPPVQISVSAAAGDFTSGQTWKQGAAVMASYGETASVCYRAEVACSAATADASFVPQAYNRGVCAAPVYVTCGNGVLWLESAKCPTDVLNVAGVIVSE